MQIIKTASLLNQASVQFSVSMKHGAVFTCHRQFVNSSRSPVYSNHCSSGYYIFAVFLKKLAQIVGWQEKKKLPGELQVCTLSQTPALSPLAQTLGSKSFSSHLLSRTSLLENLFNKLLWRCK